MLAKASFITVVAVLVSGVLQSKSRSPRPSAARSYESEAWMGGETLAGTDVNSTEVSTSSDRDKAAQDDDRLIDELALPALVVPQQRVAVRATVATRIEKILVTVGEVVQAGQPLAKLNADEIQASIAAQRGRLQVTEAKLIAAQAEKRFAEFEQQVAEALTVENAITTTEIRQRATNLEVATSRQAALQKQLEVDRHDLQVLQHRLDLYRLPAPFAGVVTEVTRYAGDFVREAEIVLRIESQQKSLKLHIPPELARRPGNLQFFTYREGSWHSHAPRDVAPHFNADGSRTARLTLPTRGDYLVGEAVEVKLLMNLGGRE